MVCPEPGGPGTGRGACCGRRRHVGAGRGALVEPAVLAVLLDAGGHGYDLKREIVERTSGRVDVDPGGLYRVLRRLEDEGVLTSSWAESEAGPQRREYEPTDEATALARDWVTHLRQRQELAGLVADALEAVLSDRV